MNPIAEAFMGKANVQLMNDAGYDFATIGNNEGITLPHDDLFHLYDEADFQVACTNLHSLTDEEPTWLRRTIEIESPTGIKIGIIGLTAPFNDFYELLHWHVSSPYEALEKHVSQLKKRADLIILMSHLGINEDRAIARKFKDIDVIIGGHTHHLLRSGEYVNETLLTAGGKYCAYVGEVILTWDHEKKQLHKKEAYTTDVTHMDRDAVTEQTIQRLTDQARERLSKTVVQIKQPIQVSWFSSTKIMHELTQTVREWTGAECAMLNSGLLLDHFPAGTITYEDVHRICPHPINPCVVEMSGDEIKEVVRVSTTKEFSEFQLNGLGFRGKVIGKMVFSGLDVFVSTHENGQIYVKHVSLNDKPLQADREYSVAVADMFTFGRLLPEVAKSKVKKYFLPEFLRDLLAHTLQTKFSTH
ncbi:MAG TPA: bifunctional UDP-sugar hydrolase/5'-nucleotidase, partial [Bacillota bacterium]